MPAPERLTPAPAESCPSCGDRSERRQQRRAGWRWGGTGSCHGPGVGRGPGSGVQVALLGMPNTDKSTLYNRLTGGDAQIANWPGLTVELPGIHDLSGSSEDEAVVQRFLRNTPPDLVLVVLNASQIASQLRLLLQIQQLGLPVVAALNMSDEARRFGLAIDHRGLSQDLGLPVHPESVRHNQGITALLDQLHRWGETPRPAGPAPVAGQGDPQALDDRLQEDLVARHVTLPERLLHRRTRLVDRVLLHPLLGVVLFLAIVLAVFQVLYVVTAPLQDLLGTGLDWIQAS